MDKRSGRQMKMLFVSIFILTLILLPAVLADNQDAIQSKPYLSPITKIMVRRVIADITDKQSIDSLKEKGCLVRHRLKDSTSLECPDNIVPQINVTTSRIFHITDLSADQQIGADKVWAQGINGTGVKVAILDTGIDMSNPELKDSYLGGYNFVGNNSIPEDDNGHGTHVAGIITSNGVDANSKGVAPGTGIYVYKVCDAGGACYEDDLLAGMEAAVSSGAKVMSMSIGGGNYTTDNCDSDTLAAKVNWVVSQGLTAVVAAGNDGSGVASPGCASGAIAVGAVDSSNSVPSWSGKGKALDIVAPGVDIYSTLINGYGRMSGTSMATPHVTGVVALLLQADPTLTTDKIKTALYSTASPVNKCYSSSSEIACTLEMTGAGIVNASKAYIYVKPAPKCTSDAQCSDGLYCNGVEKCVSGSCQKGITVNCSGSGNQCNDGVCNECLDKCVAKPKLNGTACSDGLYCNVGETCKAGVCTGGSKRVCNDGKSCTVDTCNENTDSCVFTWPTCGIKDGCCGPTCNSLNDPDCPVKCWSASYQYLYKSSTQMKKFCKCAQGTYGYNGYSSGSGNKKVFYYSDSSSDSVWTIKSLYSYNSVYQVTCTNGRTYPTNKDYFR